MMRNDPIRVLLIEDNPGDVRLIREMLAEVKDARIELESVSSLAPGLKRLDEGGIGLLLLDLSLPDGQGLDVFEKAHTRANHVPIVVLTGLDDETMAANTLQIGAQDYLVKGQIDSRLLVRTIRYSIERRQAAEAIRESEERYRLLFERSGEAIFLVDRRTGRYLDGNAAAERLTGRSAAELREMTGYQDAPWGVVQRPQQLAVIEDAVHPGEVTFVRPDGERRTALLSMVHLSEDLSFGIVRDITERKAAEQTLRESELKFRSLAEQSPNMIFITKDGGLVYANARCEELIGYRPEELCGEQIEPLGWIAAECRQTVAENLQRNLDGRDVAPYECALLTREQRQVEVQFATRLIEYEGEAAILGVVTDLTEYKQMERGLRESRERFHDLVNLLPQGVWELDKEGDFTFLNREELDSHGYMENDPRAPVSILDMFAPHERNRVREDIRRVFRGHKVGPTQYVARRADGSTFPVLVHSAAIVREGRPVGLRGVTIDLTELNKTQLQLRHSQLLASLGEMTAGIVHEVNNPLGSVVLYSELLMAEDVSTQVRKDLKVIHDEAKRAAKIMADLLTYSRRASPQVRYLDLHKVIRKVLDMREYAQKVNNVTVETVLHDRQLPVRGDSGQLTQVFMNLVLNAEEALRDRNGGRITVTTWVEGDWAKVSVADDGPGVPPEYLNQVFYPFFTTKRVGQGTGLGLSTCYGIITGHSGLIHAENSPSGGAVFTVELPLAGNRAETSPTETPLRAGG